MTNKSHNTKNTDEEIMKVANSFGMSFENFKRFCAVKYISENKLGSDKFS